MSAHAFMSGIARGVATPPTVSGVPCSFTEDFDEADIFALEAKYSAGDARWFFDDTDPITVAGGAFNLPSTADNGSHGDYEFTIVGRTTTAPTTQLWMKAVIEIIGSEYGTGWGSSSIVDPLEMGYNDVAGTMGFFIRGLYGTALDPIYSVALYAPGVSNTDDGGTGTIPSRLPVGTHTFIVCISLDDATTMRGEMWHNAAPGDAADSVATIAKPAGQTMDSPYLTVRGQEVSGSEVKALSWQVVCGSRASDPFSIL